MAIIRRLALVAAGLLGATQAQAATTLTYTFNASGSGTYQTYGNGILATTQFLKGLRITMQLAELVPSYASGYDGTWSMYVAGATNGMSIYSELSPPTAYFYGSLRGTACFSNPSGNLALVAVPVVSGCSALTFNAVLGGIVYNFSGQVTSFSVASTDGTLPSTFNVEGYVPEPSTWALMLAGFGMTGYALRRRRVRVAIA